MTTTTTTPMSEHPMVQRLASVLAAKAAKAMEQLDDLDAAIGSAFAAAETAVRAQINEQVALLEANLERRLASFSNRIADLAGDAMENVLFVFDARLAMEAGVNGHPTEMVEEVPTVEAQPLPMPEPDPVYAASAAQVVATEQPAIAEDEDEDDQQPDSDDETATAIPFVASADGLHQRHDTGGCRARYTPASDPQPGGTYYVRDHRRHWSAVIYQP